MKTTHRRKKPLSKPTVVIVDDDPTYLRVWEKIFKSVPDCSYTLTNDPNTAATMLKMKNVDLLISDIIMPGISGYELAGIAHRYNPNTKVVLTTAYDCDLSHFDLEDPNFNILYKPYSRMDDVLKFVTHLIKGEDAFEDLDEDSFSENTYYPSVMEWKL